MKRITLIAAIMLLAGKVYCIEYVSGQTAAGLVVETAARIAGDAAEASSRQAADNAIWLSTPTFGAIYNDVPIWDAVSKSSATEAIARQAADAAIWLSTPSFGTAYDDTAVRAAISNSSSTEAIARTSADNSIWLSTPSFGISATTSTFGFFVVSSTDTNTGIQDFIINESTFYVKSVRVYTSGTNRVQTDGDIICNVKGRFTGANTLIGTLKLPTGAASSEVILSTWVASKDMGLSFEVDSNTGTIKLNQIKFGVKYEKPVGQ